MRHSPKLLAVLIVVLVPVTASAQSFEGVIGLAHRSANAQDLPEDGLHAALRLGYPVAPRLRLLTSIGWTRFEDQDLVVPVLCPAPPAICNAGSARIPGLGMANLGVGLQPVLSLGGLELRPSALIGGYWLYHRGTDLPATAAGTDAGLALALPLGERARILLEGRWVHLFGSAGAVGSSRRLGIGAGFR